MVNLAEDELRPRKTFCVFDVVRWSPGGRPFAMRSPNHSGKAQPSAYPRYKAEVYYSCLGSQLHSLTPAYGAK
jgi:hypothetical protein